MIFGRCWTRFPTNSEPMPKHTFRLLLAACVWPALRLHAEHESASSPTTLFPEATKLVEEMRSMSMQFSPGGRSDGRVDPADARRHEIVDGLRALKEQSVPSLVQALADPEVQMRRNAELVLIHLAGAYDGAPKVNIRSAIPALIKNTKDEDADVRAWAAHALKEIGPAAVPAVPALISLLTDPEEGPRNTSCMALGAIGPAAREALPALRKALHDPKPDVRRFAAAAIQNISTQAP